MENIDIGIYILISFEQHNARDEVLMTEKSINFTRL